jgi:hypothetical protein
VTHLTWSEQLNKRVRSGAWTDQALPTLEAVQAALAGAGAELGVSAGRLEQAAQLIDYFMEEAKVVYSVYKVWLRGFLDWLEQQGVTAADRQAELDRLATLLAYPEGAPFEPVAHWAALGEQAGRLANRVRGGDLTGASAGAELEALRESWRQLHDRYADLMSGILTFVARRFGEDRLEECYRYVLEPYIAERYQPFDVRQQPYADTLFRNVYLTFEAMRAHLCGPQRHGEIEFEELADRYVFRFDPCGSGGRTLRGDPEEGSGSRVLPPYNFGVTQARHDWAWNEQGICYYCAHCCLALERLPAERWGHPVRVVDPPVWGGPDAASTTRKCQWTIYKQLEAIPESAYARIGLHKPPATSPPERTSP